MKASDYIISFLISKGITNVFGYPGGMVTHLMDSFDKFGDNVRAHVNYHEQGASFCACSYAQVSKKPGCAFATSGPGATNLITGIANAFFDSIPCIFITGQVNTYESKGELRVRQKGFQETDIISMVSTVTKYAKLIENADELRYELEKAYYISTEGRPGPVLLDIPMNIQRAEIDEDAIRGFEAEVWKEEYRDGKEDDEVRGVKEVILRQLNEARKPLIVAGAGVDSADVVKEFRCFVEKTGIPVVTSMIGVDILPTRSRYNYGFIGAYGHRAANFLVAHSDLIITIGSRLDNRQTGANLEKFAENAKVLKIEVDEGEATNKVKKDEVVVFADLRELLPLLCKDVDFNFGRKYAEWLSTCDELKNRLSFFDDEVPKRIVNELSKIIPDSSVITTDVGQNQVWVAQGFEIKENQRVIFSGGHGAMGYSLPAAIGAYYASGRNVYSFNGDGGLQMNIQELQFIARDKLPIKIILLNNKSLGMIRHFQEMYFKSNFVQTKAEKGYTTPDFGKISMAYGIDYYKVDDIRKVPGLKEALSNDLPVFIEVELSDTTYVFPKLSMGRPIHDQDPLMDRELFATLLALDKQEVKNVLVTGATSFLGVSLVKLLLKKGYRVFCVVRPASGNLGRLPGDENLVIFELDLEDYCDISKHVAVQCGAFYHLAWDGVRGAARDDKLLQRKNYIATINAINEAKKLGCKIFAGIGSQAEYGVLHGEIDEKCKTQPVSEYGTAKLRAYNEGLELCKALDIKFLWCRIFSLYGCYDYENSLIMSCLGKMSSNSPISLTEGSQMWDYLYVDDAADAILSLAESYCEAGAYNVASGASRPLKEFILRLKAITGSQSELNFGEIPFGTAGAVGFQPDIDKLVNAINWQPKVTFEAGINIIIDYLKRDEANEKN